MDGSRTHPGRLSAPHNGFEDRCTCSPAFYHRQWYPLIDFSTTGSSVLARSCAVQHQYSIAGRKQGSAVPRRSPGEGSITQRKDGRWQAALQVEGKRRTIYGRTRREVVQKLEALRRQAVALGALPDPGRRTVSDLLMAWLEAVTPSLKPRTLHDYRAVCEGHIRPAMGRVLLERITPARIQELYTALQDRPRTALKAHRALDQAFTLAVRWGWLAENPCGRTIRPQYRPDRREMWTDDELRVFLVGAREHWLYPLWVCAIATGCRMGELLALAWSDVSLERKALSVTKSGQHIGGQWTVTTPKTRAGRREISLPPEAVAALTLQRAMQAERRLKAGPSWENVTDLVFTGVRGQPLAGSNAAHALRHECKRLGLPAMTPHGLRHLHASLLLAQGLPVPMVSQRLGHANPGITMSIYAHAIGREDGAATRAIGRAMNGDNEAAGGRIPGKR